jgi:peptidoglycan L-alanyl-D-glutamate endopeptidase CwlK
MFKLGAKSLANLNGVHPVLVGVVKRAIEISVQDFSVHDGLRTLAEQRALFARKATKTLNSKHLPQSDGLGHAVDLVPYINGQLRWEWGPIYDIAAAMRRAAEERSVAARIVWGGAWDAGFDSIDATDSAMERAVSAYVDRRRAAGRSAFIDGPHFELRS